jgi:hypothetical protein
LITVRQILRAFLRGSGALDRPAGSVRSRTSEPYKPYTLGDDLLVLTRISSEMLAEEIKNEFIQIFND